MCAYLSHATGFEISKIRVYGAKGEFRAPHSRLSVPLSVPDPHQRAHRRARLRNREVQVSLFCASLRLKRFFLRSTTPSTLTNGGVLKKTR